MKVLFYILIFVFLSQYSKETACTSKTDPSAVKDCTEIELEEDEEKCCYFHWSINSTTSKKEENYCMGLTAEQYEDIKTIIKNEVEKKEKDSTVQSYIDCGTNYLIISILSLILLFL